MPVRGRPLPHLAPPLAALLVALLLGVRPVPPARAATLPEGFTDSVVASGLASPTAMAFAPDGRLFVAQQGGQLRVIKNGTLLATPFLTVPVDATGERGLLGVAFDPNFATNQFVYVYYTATSPAVHNRVSRFTASGDVAQPGSERVIVELENLSSATNHNGGAIHFGPDGRLYIAVGENAAPSNAQSLTNRLGKVLRVNADGSIPTDNPFFNQATGENRSIWALGLRNPFTFAFQPGSGRMFINDVGQATWEEINDGIAGSNYGWPATEGPTTDPRFRAPLYAYRSDSGAECAITGGAFYNPAVAQFPAAYTGAYFFADFCAGWIRRFDPATNAVTDFASGISSPVDLQVSADGSLYYLARGGGVVGRIQFTGGQAPRITSHPQSQAVAPGQPVTFSCAASGAAPLTYQWQRNGSPIAGAAGSSYSIASVSAADNGARFRCVVSNSFGSATSNEATLTVSGNAPPSVTILSPAAGTLYRAGDRISYSGAATDPEDAKLPLSAFTWEVVFHHDTHTHPFIGPLSGVSGGSFTIPDLGETDANVWYRISLTVRDSGGATATAFRDVRPRTATLSFATNPAGLQLTLDRQPRVAPFSVVSVVGMQRSIEAPSPQSLSGTSYQFTSWSDGGGRSHTIRTPDADTTYTATFSAGSDSNPPQITGVQAQVQGGPAVVSATITWSTDEPATSAVEYGTSPALGQTQSVAGLVTSHAVTIGGLKPGVTLYYRVRSRDGAGNESVSPVFTAATRGG